MNHSIEAKKSFMQKLKRDWPTLLLVAPLLIIVFLFCYLPIFGVLIAFQDYKIGGGILAFDHSIQWVGFEHFSKFIKSIFFGRIFSNTLRLSVLNLVIGFWVPILFALLLNEIKNRYYKKVAQTFVYLPYFVSTVIVVAILKNFVSSNGVVNRLIMLFGGEAVNFMNDPVYFDWLYVISNIWQVFGYSSIIYLAAISSINPVLYDAASIDGANRLRKAIHITLPGIMPTIMIILILSTGNLLATNTEKILLMYNPTLYDTADVIGTYIYRTGLIDLKYSYTAAVGVFSNIINFILIFSANLLSRKYTEYSIW